MLISQCSGNALTQTRRIIDQFAERKGDRTWSTPITLEGMTTLRKLLRKTARRNTAVACHLMRRGGSELLWIVGNARRFNLQGGVPTNRTLRDVLRSDDENRWHTGEAISLLAGLAGLFHDVGKANKLFQQKLTPASKLRQEPWRHEWVSLRIFQAFVDGRDDAVWLQALLEIAPEHEPSVLARLQDICEGAKGSGAKNAFQSLPPLARMIGWLIVSHHRLPEFTPLKEGLSAPDIGSLTLCSRDVDASWNSPQSMSKEWESDAWRQVWQFPHGTPLRSKTWCDKAHQLARRALLCRTLIPGVDDKPESFTPHLARLCLMLADHAYSAGPAYSKWQDPAYRAWANTDKEGKPKQALDEHNIGVAHHGWRLAKYLPDMRRNLPSIARHKGFRQRSANPRYRWQDKAFELAQCLASGSKEQGFFGVNMASTGCGKTLANARIMYGLSHEAQGCRFSIALGLRTLTLQTGDALRERLKLESDDLAVLIGSSSVKELYEMSHGSAGGSESAAEPMEPGPYVVYDGTLEDGFFKNWMRSAPRVHQLVSTPILVSTIDHIIQATEGTRGGRQIAPMLRLLSADLVLDEPDEFGMNDLPALCRLVNWAGVLGSRVLLSSATLQPALVAALFDAYQAGRAHYHRACGLPGAQPGIICAWFDEHKCESVDVAAPGAFNAAHKQFVAARIVNLEQSGALGLRLGQSQPVARVSDKAPDICRSMAESIYDAILHLHRHHHQQHESGKRVSLGVVRMANIDYLVGMSQALLAMAPPASVKIHFCLYHSQYPMMVRSHIEQRLDKALDRHDEKAVWQIPEIAQALNQPEQDHLFVVLASPVAEVGRDHDYDWAVIEPSSVRSIIQMSGRVQRHRKQMSESPNVLILEQNHNALAGKPLAYCRPGFESKAMRLIDHQLNACLPRDVYRQISAAPAIQVPPETSLKAQQTRLVQLEHAQLHARLFGFRQSDKSREEKPPANEWWKNQLSWSGELQRRTRFRESQPTEIFVLWQEDEYDPLRFYQLNNEGRMILRDNDAFERDEFVPARGVEPWFNLDPEALLAALAESQDMTRSRAAERYGLLMLRKDGGDAPRPWRYDPLLGIYRAP